jgi:hypothetical protein
MMFVGDIMGNKQFFIHTSDKETAEKLRELGYEELPKEGSQWVFINNASLTFSSDDSMKVNFTDKITF